MNNLGRIIAIIAVFGIITAAGITTVAERSAANAARYEAVSAATIIVPDTLPYTNGAFYPLDDNEFDLISRVVMAEAGGEPYKGQIAVAQCILNACVKTDKRPAEVVKKYGYTTWRPNPSETVKEAVSDVFDYGVTITDEEILYFYAPEQVTSDWHESQNYVCTIGGHRFFTEK